MAVSIEKTAGMPCGCIADKKKCYASQIVQSVLYGCFLEPVKEVFGLLGGACAERHAIAPRMAHGIAAVSKRLRLIVSGFGWGERRTEHSSAFCAGERSDRAQHRHAALYPCAGCDSLRNGHGAP